MAAQEVPTLADRIQDLADDHGYKRFSRSCLRGSGDGGLSYRPFLTFLQTDLKYVVGQNLFIFPYDWR